jgi:hypothetical protein
MKEGTIELCSHALVEVRSTHVNSQNSCNFSECCSYRGPYLFSGGNTRRMEIYVNLTILRLALWRRLLRSVVMRARSVG